MVELIFDRKLLRQNQKRHNAALKNHDFLYNLGAEILLENLSAQGFNQGFDAKGEGELQTNKQILEISARNNILKDFFEKTPSQQHFLQTSFIEGCANCNAQIVCDDEYLPFKNESFDIILSNLNLHHINIIPQFLLDVKRILKKNGVFLASFFGENNLFDLKKAVFEAENEVFGQISPRFMPVIDVKNAALLLQKAGFKNPVSSLETIDVEYENPIKLLQDIKFMAQGNILLKRDKKFINRKFLDAILNNYGKIGGLNKKIKARFEIVIMVGWAL